MLLSAFSYVDNPFTDVAGSSFSYYSKANESFHTLPHSLMRAVNLLLSVNNVKEAILAIMVLLVDVSDGRVVLHQEFAVCE